MMTDTNYQITRTYEVNRATRDMTPAAALKRIKLILDSDAILTDDQGYVISTNPMHEAAQGFIRDNLDLKGMGVDSGFTTDYPDLDPAFARHILDDLAIIWNYEFYRDDLSHIAMQLSLCPMHFCDWAACFDDDEDECSTIRAIFPHHHDT